MSTKIKTMRKFLKLSQKYVARKAGVASSSLCMLEKNGCFNTKTAIKYAAAMGCDPIFLLEGLDVANLPPKF